MIRSKQNLKKLRQIRKEKNITSKEMAKRLNISRAFYCQIENRSRRLTYEMAVKIARVFKMKPDKIFYDDFNSDE